MIEKGVQPSEYWSMDVLDIFEILEIDLSGGKDTSGYTNDRRVFNGMNESDLRNTLDG
jgi:hypothetical protein